jgi:ribosomal protein L21E
MFKVGDRVVVVKNKLGGPNTFLGQQGKVLDITDEALSVNVLVEGYGEYRFMREELELLDMHSNQKFQVGDRVVVVDPGRTFFRSRGEVVEVFDRSPWDYKVKLPDEEWEVPLPYLADELEHEFVYDMLSAPPADEDSSMTQVDMRPNVDHTGNEGEDVINHPSHYADGWSNGAEVIDITEHLNFNRGNAVKYLSRAGKKGGSEKELEDLQKALWYVTREVLRLGGTV